MNVIKSMVPVCGLTAPVKVVHITDSHLSFAKAEEGARECRHARERRQGFETVTGGQNAKDNFLSQLSYAADADACVMTGDIIDFPSQANLELLRQNAPSAPGRVLYTLGNHDWCYPWEKPVAETLLRHQGGFTAWYGNDVTFNSTQIGGLLFVGIDNSTYQFSRRQRLMLACEFLKGLPVVLFFHIPLFAPSLASPTVKDWGRPILAGCPQDVLAQWGRDFGEGNNLTPSADTLAFLSLLEENAPKIAAVLAGHVHFSHEDETAGGLYQLVTRAGCYGEIREILFTPQKN